MLPRSSEATVESAKVRDYLLSTSHPLGRFKAAVFFGLGYTPDDWPRLRDDLKSHAASPNVELDGAGAFGQKYVVTGPLTGPSGKTISLRTIWIISDATSAPRLVTAYPE